jgi:chemotaxis protein MotA
VRSTLVLVQEGKSVGFIGILLVFGAVLGGYLMEGGDIGVLIQPAEFVIILGAALGIVLISV